MFLFVVCRNCSVRSFFYCLFHFFVFFLCFFGIGFLILFFSVL